ncbi:MAG: VanZ family protein [Pseudomonadota bacterium]
MNHLFAYMLTLVLAGIIARVTLGPVGEVSPPFAHLVQFAHFDKLVHAAAFAALAFPLSVARTHSWSLIFLVGLAFGGLIELIQPRFGRTADWFDLLADAFGLLIGIAIGSLTTRERPAE